MEQIRRIMRPCDVPDQGLLCDLLWSDPDKDTLGWGENDRGVSFTFGVEVRVNCRHHPHRIADTNHTFRTRAGGQQVSDSQRMRPDLPRPSGRRGRLRVLLEAPAGHAVLGAELLR